MFVDDGLQFLGLYKLIEESRPLLPHAQVPRKQKMAPTTLGKVRAYWLGSVVCMGGFLFGYDSGM
jgi:hypothetical protein